MLLFYLKFSVQVFLIYEIFEIKKTDNASYEIVGACDDC